MTVQAGPPIPAINHVQLSVVNDVLGSDMSTPPYYNPAEPLSAIQQGAFQTRVLPGGTPVNPADARRYGVAMAAGAEFPGLLITEDRLLADGNHRKEGHQYAGHTTAPVVVIPIDYSKATPEVQWRIRYVAQVLNAKNGVPLNRTALKMLIENGIAAGRTPAQIEAETGLRKATVNGIKRDVLGEKTIKSLGLPTTKAEAIDPKAVRTLGDLSTGGTTPDVLLPVAELAADAALSPSQVKKVQKRMVEAKVANNDVLDQAAVATIRDEFKKQISTVQTTGRPMGKTEAQKLQTRLTALLINSGPGAKFKASSSEKAQFVADLDQAIAFLQDVKANNS